MRIPCTSFDSVASSQGGRLHPPVALDGKVQLPHMSAGSNTCYLYSYRGLQLITQIVAKDDVLPDGTKIRAGCQLAYSPYLMGRGNHNCSAALMIPQLFVSIE